MSFEPNEEVESIRKSKYNSGIAKEMRRSDLWKDVNSHKRSGLFSKWNEDLDCIWCELVADAKKKNIFDDKKEEFEKFDKEIVEIGQIIDRVESSFEATPADVSSKRAKHYKKLMEKEIFLRNLEEDVGKGTAWDDDDEDGF